MAAPAPPGPIDLDQIKAPPVVPSEPDKESKQEIDDLEREEKHLRNISLGQDIWARKKYAFRVFILVAFWITAVLGILILQGFAVCRFHLSDSVLLAAIGSTTANIIGILVIVVKYLFADRSNPSSKRKGK